MINSRVPVRKLPFTRFYLGVIPIQDSLPKGMENVPLHVWTDFCSRTGVIAKHVDRVDTMGLVISISFWLGAAASLRFFDSPLSILLAIACILTAHTGALHLKKYTFTKLKNFVSEEEARTFIPYGFVLECPYVLPNDHLSPKGYYLHIIPSTTNGNDVNDLSPPEMSCQRGYLRVEVVKGDLCGWNTPPALPFYDYLPDEMVSVSLADWSEFWSKMDTLSSTAVSSIRRLQLIVWLYIILVLSMNFAGYRNETVLWIYMIGTVPLWMLEFYYLCCVSAINSDIQNVCNEYADQFEQQGVYMEFRHENDWTALSCLNIGGNSRRYIYLFPVQQS